MDSSGQKLSTQMQILGYVLMALVVVIVGLPLLWMALGSLKTNQEIYSLPTRWLPSAPRWDNFADAWNAAPFGQFYINSIIITVAGAALKVVNATMTAYAFAFLRFPGKNWLFLLLLAALMIPAVWASIVSKSLLNFPLPSESVPSRRNPSKGRTEASTSAP